MRGDGTSRATSFTSKAPTRTAGSTEACPCGFPRRTSSGRPSSRWCGSPSRRDYPLAVSVNGVTTSQNMALEETRTLACRFRRSRTPRRAIRRPELPSGGPRHPLQVVPHREYRLRLKFRTSVTPHMLLSLVVPVYREEKNIPEFIRRVGPILGAVTQDYEIIFAMDPSPDRTEDVILEERAKDARIKLLKFSRRFGQPMASLAGHGVFAGGRGDRDGRGHAGPAGTRAARWWPSGARATTSCSPRGPADRGALDQAARGRDRLQGHQQDRRRRGFRPTPGTSA